MPQLDGLRAVAILAVLPVHFLHESAARYVDTGVLGVRLFFVLSGFLIGSILLRYRERIASGASSLRHTLRTFYFRRFLRLSPPYLAYLALAFLMFPADRHYLPWFLLYLQNFLFAIKPELFGRYLVHFWTLAIEEQFYLVAPIVLLCAPKLRLAPFMIGLVALAPMFRGLVMATGYTAHQANMLVPGQMDTLCIGVLLAIYRHASPLRARRLETLGLFLGLPLTIVVLVMRHIPGLSTLHAVFENTALSLLFVWLVGATSTGLRGPLGSLLESAPFTYVGRISYGIYVYHFNVPGILRTRLFPLLGWDWPSSPMLRFLIATLGSIFVAAISYHLVEAPILRYKDRFR